jgi:hypothetical protein
MLRSLEGERMGRVQNPITMKNRVDFKGKNDLVVEESLRVEQPQFQIVS